MAGTSPESSDTQFLALSPRAQKYIDTANAVSELRELAAVNPQDADQYAPGISRGEVIMSITESAAVEDFIAVIEVQEPKDRAERRKIIESIREDEDFGTVITEDDIQCQLDALPPFPDYLPEVREFVGGYFEAIGQWLIAVNGEPVPEALGTPDQAKEGTDVDGQTDPEAAMEKPELTITVYKDQVIQLGEDGEMVPLLRTMEVPKTTQEELYIADARLAALRLVAGHEPRDDDKGLASDDVWRTYAGDKKLNSSQHLIVLEFLESLQVDGEPVLDIYKPTDAAKRRYYRNGGFAVTFVESDQESGFEQNGIFRLPNGEMLFGKRARVANMLIRASEDKPVSSQDLLDSDVYSEEEKAEMGDKITLSSMVSFLRQSLEQEGLLVVEDGPSYGYNIKSIKQPDRSLVYWMEYHDKDDAAEPAPEIGETEYERDRSIADCRMVADWLVENQEILVRLGYEPFDAEAQSALQAADILEPETKTSKQLQLRLVFDAVKIVASIDSSVEEVIDKVPEDDPRWPIIDYLLISGGGSGDRIPVNSLVEDFPELDLRVDEQLATIHDGLLEWPGLRDEKRKEVLAELTYDLFDRIGTGLQKKHDTANGSPKNILPEIRKRLLESGLMPISIHAEQAFNQAYGQWIHRTTPSSSARTKRREWGKQVRIALNSVIRAR